MDEQTTEITEQTEAVQEQAPNPELAALQEKYDRLAGLERYVEALGGAEPLIELASYGHQVRTNPQLQTAIQSALSGTTSQPPQATADEEEFYDPEVKALQGKLTPEIQRMQQENAELQTRLARAEVAALTPRLERNIESAMDFFKGDKDLQAAAIKEIQDALKQTQSLAERGDKQAIAQIESLSSPAGTRTLKMMAIDTYEKYVDKMAKRSAETPVIKATDERHTTRAALPANTVAVRPGRVTTEVTLDVLNRVAERLGKDPNTLFN